MDNMEDISIKYRCAKCGAGPLKETLEGLACPGCGSRAVMSGRIAELAGDLPYYGEVPREKMAGIVLEARDKGWKRALFDNFFESYNFLYKIATYETRADWLYLLDLSPAHRVLDVGSGWGTEALPLARNAGSVVAMDGTRERLEFLMVRASQEGVENITGIWGSILNPPLMPEQFDLVVMNGVLEWMGVANDEDDPAFLQMRALENARSLLKKGGRIYIGIENSHGYKYLLGEPDDHTGLRNITFLPREEADSLMRSSQGKGYRTYTYNYSGYKQILEGAGFGGIQFYYPMPDYKIFTCIAPLDNKEVFGYVIEKLNRDSEPGGMAQNIRNLERTAHEMGTLKGHVSSYGIIAEKV